MSSQSVYNCARKDFVCFPASTMALRRLLLLLTALAAFLHHSEGSIQCYTCVSTVNELTCVNDPDNVLNGSPVTDCDKGDRGCCTIFRQEYVEEPGKVISFSRGCQENCPSKMSTTETVDASYRIYQTYCNTPKCNVGPGDKPLTGIGGGGNGGDNIIGPIPGKDGTATANAASLGLLLSALVLALLRY
ncbi:uncharacterized protein LOC122262110 [Penaeus japonicus]|uniref:uncharacterized protein LOC122262110 n=1 Tax=Penaeus japonicus TaxID=27405 RepID=UPI001C70DA00|nr:uncharacterized protein LOC122262110 [Penaeus japonicus]